MEEPVVSKFAPYYYMAAIGKVLIAVLSSYILFRFGITKQIITVDLTALIALGIIFSGTSFYFVITGTKVIAVDAQGIAVYYPLRKKEMIIHYNDVASVDTYRARRDPNKYGTIYSQTFLIELTSGKTISFNFQDYLNYDELKAAIYKYKLGIGA